MEAHERGGEVVRLRMSRYHQGIIFTTSLLGGSLGGGVEADERGGEVVRLRRVRLVHGFRPFNTIVMFVLCSLISCSPVYRRMLLFSPLSIVFYVVEAWRHMSEGVKSSACTSY